MNRLFKIFLFLLLFCPLSVNAQLSMESAGDGPYPTQVEEACNAKPYIHFTFDGTAVYTDAACSNKASNMVLRNYSTFSYTVEGSDEVKSPSFFVSIENGKLTYFVNDMEYIPAGATVTISTPSFYTKTDDDNAEITQFSAHTYTFPVTNIVEISSSCNSSDLNIASPESKTLVVTAPNVLTVNSNLDVANIIVEAGDVSTYAAGVVVENGGSIAIADTAYFLCHNYFHRNNAYLINRGSYSASASIFTKCVDNRYLSFPYAYKYGYLSTKKKPTVAFYNTANISFPVEEPNDIFGFVTANKKFFANLPYAASYSGSANTETYYYLGSPLYKERNQYQFIVTYDSSTVFRANGLINDEAAYSVKLVQKAYNNGGREPIPQIDNVYQAGIDWSKLIADEVNNPGLADQLRGANFSGGLVHLSYDYNFATGLTTYDGPMQFGYVQPVMEPARFYQVDTLQKDITINLVKEYLTSYAEMEKVKPNVTVPYVRFYIDDVDCPKGVGNRSIYVAYFVPQDEYDALKESDDYSSLYGVNLKNEVFAPVELGYRDGTEGGVGYRFPFICTLHYGSYVNRIKAFPLPEKSKTEEVEPFGMMLYLDPKQEKVKFGILDYGNMDSLQVECAGLLLNAIDKRPNVLEAEFDANSFDETVFSVANSGYKYIDVNAKRVHPTQIQITSYAQKKPSSDKKLVDNAFSVSSVHGGIVVTSEIPVQVSVVNISGVLVNNTNVEGRSFISLPDGLYVVKNNNGNSSKVLVK